MKIEPKKTASLPKYAAVMAAAVMLTGCTPGGVTLEGDVAVLETTQVTAQTTEPEIDGFLDVRPDVRPDETDPVEEEISLTDAFAANSEIPVTDGFFDQAGFVLGVPGWLGETAEFAGESQKVWLMNEYHQTMVCLYEAGSGMEERLRAAGAEQFDWGFAGVTTYPRCVLEPDETAEEEAELDPEELEFRQNEQQFMLEQMRERQETYRTAFIAVSPDRAEALTEEEAGQIARDLLGDTETVVQ